MQNIGDQIEINKGKDTLEVTIYPKVSGKDQRILNFWLIAWSLCGLAVLSQLILPGNYQRSEKVFMLIYLAFWIYLELKVVYAFRWNKNGKELIEIKDGKLSYTQLIGKRGLPIVYNLSEVSQFRYANETEKGIWNDINRSAWMVGGEVIQFTSEGKVRRIGMKLNQKDAERLSDLLNKYRN